MQRNRVTILHNTKLLVSVKSADEAQIALENGADLIDLKDPSIGALGALPVSLIQSIVQTIKQSKPNAFTSATIGDQPMQAALLTDSVKKLAITDADFIKIGFFEAIDYQPCLDQLSRLTQQGAKLIAVLFAENTYPDSLIQAIKQAGFIGVMLDTAQKNGNNLFHYYHLESIEAFAQKAQINALSYGFAGSLQSQHVAQLLGYNPNFLGFRGGVCEQNQRDLQLNPAKIGAIKTLLTN